MDAAFLIIMIMFIIGITGLMTVIVLIIPPVRNPEFIKTDPPPIDWDKVNEDT